MKRAFIVAMSAGLVYLAFVLPSRMLRDTITAGTVTPSRTDAPTVTPNGHTMPEQVTPFPAYSVTVEVLEVRSGAGETFPNVGYLRRGDSVTVYEVQAVTGETCRHWARIGAGVWTCYDMLEAKQ